MSVKRESRYTRRMAASAPADLCEAVAYWSDLSVKQAEKSVRYGEIAYRLMTVAVVLQVLALILRLVG